MSDSRLSPEYWAWRAAVVKRDKHKCQYPGCNRKKYLEVHHILPWATNHHLRYEVTNGICLCKKHHKSIKGKELYYTDVFILIVFQNGKSGNNPRQ